MKSYEELMKKTQKLVKDKKLDLSSDEDLSLGVMNLISIEEHLHFTAQKTGKDFYLDLLREVRNMRKVFLKKLIKDYEGEVWCTSKHLLSASMRFMEVGTKHLDKKEMDEAKLFFENSYNLYSLFWMINIENSGSKEIKKEEVIKEEKTKSESFFNGVREFVKKAVDCCKE